MYFVKIPAKNTKTNQEKSFAIRGAMLDIVRKYENLRPAHTTSDRFFLNYQKGKCTTQVIGKCKFYKMPRRIAAYLKLPDADRYTGNCSLSFVRKSIAHSSLSKSIRTFSSPDIDNNLRQHRSECRSDTPVINQRRCVRDTLPSRLTTKKMLQTRCVNFNIVLQCYIVKSKLSCPLTRMLSRSL